MKRAISLILVLVMLFGIMPIPAMAGELSETTAAQEETEEIQELQPEETTQQTEEPPAITETVPETTTQATEETPTQATEGEPTQATEEPQPSETVETQPAETAAEPPKEPELLTWEDYRYTLLADGTASVCGFTGTPEDGDEPFFVELPSDIQGVTVTEIGERAFAENAELDSILLPETLKAVGDGALEACENLKWIGFRGEAPSFGESLVKDCGKLEEIAVLAEEDYTPLQELLKTDLGEEAAQNVRFQSFADVQALEEYYITLIPEAPAELSSTAESVMSTSTAPTSGKCGANLTWELSSDGTLTISGTGKMDDYSGQTSVPWLDFKDKITSINIAQGVTYIGNYSFYNCGKLTSIIIPNGVTEIGSDAFSSCSGLTDICIPGSVTTIGRGAFANCFNSGVTGGIKIPDGVVTIEADAFNGCLFLTSVAIPKSVTSIGISAFKFCYSLTDVYYSGTEEKWNGIAIDIGNENLTNAEIHCNYSDTTVVQSGTCGANLTWELNSAGTLTISGTGKMNDYEYDYVSSGSTAPWNKYCEEITCVTIDHGVASIGSDAFYGCSNLSSVTIPNGVTSIGQVAFSYCRNLSSVSIPDSVTSIGSYAFSHCSSLSSVTIPASVTSIADETFSGCSSLRSVTIPDSVTSVGDRAFYGCSSMSSVTIPDSITSIGNSVFSGCSSLSSVTIPNSVTSIGYYAFSRCSLTSVAIPDSVTSIGDDAFFGCSRLSSVTIPDSVTYIGDGAFRDCSSLSSVTIPDSVTYIGGLAFDKTPWLDKQTETFVIHGDGVLLKYNGLEANVAIPVSVKMISGAFYQCESMTSVTIPDSVTSIGYYAFGSCSNLANVTIPNSVTSIGNFAFNGCSSLSSVTIPGSVTSIGGSAFGGCSSLSSVTIPHSVTSIGGYAFEGCSSLSSVTIPDSVTSIGDLTFYGCSSLTSVIIPGSVTSIGESAFLGCTGLIDVYYSGNEAEWKTIAIGSYNENLLNATIHFNSTGPVRVWDYLDNSAIQINASGDAYAFFEGEPLQTFHYSVGGTQGSAQSNEEGVFCVPLGSFDSVADYQVPVEITQIGDEILTNPIVLDTTVTVTPLSFSQDWKASFDTSVGAELKAGADAKLGPIKVDAALCGIGVEGGAGNSLKISRSISEEGETLEFTSDKKIEGGGTVKSGITGEILNTSISVQGSAGIKKSITGTYGLKIENYSPDNSAQQRAIATYLLGEALQANPSNILFKAPYDKLAQYVYNDAGCTTIEGSGTGISASAGVDIGKIKVNDIDLFSVADMGTELTQSMSEKRTSAGEREKSMSLKSSAKVAFLAGKASINDADMEIAALTKKFLGPNISVTAKCSEGEKSLETTSLNDSSIGDKWLILGQHSTEEYNKFTFRDDALSGLLSNSRSFNAYLNSTRMVLSALDLAVLGITLSNSDAPIEYSREVKDTVVYSFPFDFGLGLGVSAKLGVDLSYEEETSYSDAAGFAKDDQLFITGQSTGIGSQVDANKKELPDIFKAVIRSIADDIAYFFEQVGAAIQEGVETTWAWIADKADSVHNWVVTITSARNGSSVWAMSERVSVLALHTAMPASDNIRVEGNNYELSKAATIGRPFVVDVCDSNTGDSITDLSADPLTFTIRYAQEDLTAAGLSAHSAIVLDDGIAMYRYSDNGDYFEYVGGVNDLDAMTVTATIDKPGQYVLAVDACAPQITSLDVSDFHANPTITASINDLTGLDINSFQFKLDGIVKVDAGNIAEHYNSQAGIFTYTVPEGESLSEGRHTIDFVVTDTTGNTETYSYSFCVDLTAPEFSQVSVSGTTNAGSCLEIRAQISDENLASAYAVFSMRLPDGTWSEEVSTEMGQLEDGSWALDYEGSGSSVKVYVLAVDIAGNRTSSETYEAKPVVESVQLTQEYVLLREGQNETLQAEVLPAELASMVYWQVEDGGEDIISVDQSGNITALKQGTAYVLATVNDGDGTMTARCRVDVAERIRLEGIQLGATSLTTELFSTQYASFDVILLLEQNQPVFSTFSLRDPVQNNGVAITSARFEDEAAAERFDLTVQDDRTLLVVPKQTAIDNPRSVAKSYTSRVCVNVDGEEYTTDASMKLTVKQSKPKLKTAALTFNSFYTGQSQPIQVSGATVTGILRDGSKDTAKSSALPKWLTLSDGTLFLNENAPAKAASGNVYILVETEEWAISTAVKVPVKLTNKAPGVKLSQNTVTFASSFADSQGVSLKLVCTSKKDTLEKLHISGIEAPERFEVRDVDLTDGTFILKPTQEVSPGKKTILVNFSDTDKQLPLTLTVKQKTVTLSAKPSTVTLNSILGDSAVIPLTAAPADYRITAPSFRLVDGKGVDTDELDYRFENGAVTVSTNAATVPGATYKLYVRAGGSKEKAITVKTLAEKKAVPTLTLKATGTVDLSFPESAVTVKPVFKNYYSGESTLESWSVYKDKTLQEDVTECFCLEEADGAFRITREDGKDGAELEPGSYTLSLSLTPCDDSKQSKTTTINKTVTIKVKRTAVKLKLSRTSLSLNKAIEESASVGLTCTTKNYGFTQPLMTLMDSKGNVSAEGAEGMLKASYKDGMVTVEVNGDNTRYGETYKLLIQATQEDKPVTLTVKIPAQSKSGVTASLKTSGTLDVIRDSTFITVKPTYKNYLGQSALEKVVTIRASRDGRNYTEDVTGQFLPIQWQGGGSFTVAKAPGVQLDTGMKYRVELSFPGVPGSVTAKKTFAVKSGKAAVKLGGEAELYRMDRYSRAVIPFTVRDRTLNSIARVEIKDKKLAALYQIHDYGGGQFAVGFRDDTVSPTAKSCKLALNVYMDGNASAKPNATVTLKLNVK